MSRSDLLLWVFCLIDDKMTALCRPRLRTRGRQTTTLTDAEVIAIELVGEFWGLDTDKGTYRHFRDYHRAEFPALPTVHRTTFARQAANLCAVKRMIQDRLSARLGAGQPVWLVDSLPVEACRFARATFCERFVGEADYGYDHCVKRTLYGFRLHVRATRDGVIQASEVTPARTSDKAVLPELDPPAGRSGLGTGGTTPRPWPPSWRRPGCGSSPRTCTSPRTRTGPGRPGSARSGTGWGRSMASWPTGTT